MTPRTVLICSFVVGCMIIAGGAIIGPKEHRPKARDVHVAATSDGIPTKSVEQGPSPQKSAVPDTPPESARQTSPQPTQSVTATQSPTQPAAAPPDGTQQASKPPGTESPDSKPTAYSPSLPVMFTYEAKKNRETTSVIARDPKGFWIRQIVAKIEEKKADLPKSLDGPVAVQLEFVVGRNGALISKSISKSSGSEEADKTAIAMLERAQPFPPMPDGLQDQEMTFSLPVRFR